MCASKNTNLISTIIESLRRVATVPVEMDGVEDRDKITISRLKLEQIMSSYQYLYVLVNKCWSNLPDPPCDEMTYLFVWIIASDGYCVNHRTISWTSSTPNTFVHVWSIVDRIRMSLESTDLSWVLGTRNCPDYCRHMDMPGALDQYLYRPETVLPSQIADIDRDVFSPVHVDERAEFCSFFDFCTDALVDSGPRTIDVSEMAMNNDEISRTGSNVRTPGSGAP